MSVPKEGVDAPDLNPFNSTVLWLMPERAKTHAVQSKVPNHKPPILSPATLDAPPTLTHTHTNITPLYFPTTEAVTRVTEENFNSTRHSSCLCAELGFQRACVNIRGAPELKILQISSHPSAGMFHHFRDHGAPATTAKSMKTEHLRAAIWYG